MSDFVDARNDDLTPPKSKSTKVWWFVGGGIALGLLICCGGVVALFGVVFGALKASEPFQQSLARVKAHSQVIAALGEPIEDDTLFVTGNLKLNNDSGHAALFYTVRGPKGSAAVNLDAFKADGVWTFTTLEAVVNQTGNRIDLLDDSDSGSGETDAVPEP